VAEFPTRHDLPVDEAQRLLEEQLHVAADPRGTERLAVRLRDLQDDAERPGGVRHLRRPVEVLVRAPVKEPEGHRLLEGQFRTPGVETGPAGALIRHPPEHGVPALPIVLRCLSSAQQAGNVVARPSIDCRRLDRSVEKAFPAPRRPHGDLPENERSRSGAPDHGNGITTSAARPGHASTEGTGPPAVSRAGSR